MTSAKEILKQIRLRKKETSSQTRRSRTIKKMMMVRQKRPRKRMMMVPQMTVMMDSLTKSPTLMTRSGKKKKP